MEQLTIDGGAKPLTRPAPRQDAVLALLRAHPDGCTADEIGAVIHASAGKHAADSVCKWCGPDSREPLRALERKKLVTRTCSGLFTLRNIEPYGGSFGEFPEVF